MRQARWKWALCLMPLSAMAQADDEAGAQANTDNAQVLQVWQAQTGQPVWLNGAGEVEFHGEMSVEAYGQRVHGPRPPTDQEAAAQQADPLRVLVPHTSGDYGRAVFKGDLRTTSPEEDVTYLQMVATGTNDHAVQSRYATQFNSLQTGRAGPGYQIALGDVVAGFSGLSSNLGLRGVLLARQFEQATLTGFGGTVAESWESLLNRHALDGQPPRTQPLRDVLGAKLEYALTRTLATFATVQTWDYRLGAVAPAAANPWGNPLGINRSDGWSSSVGARYAEGTAQLSLEWAKSYQKAPDGGARQGGSAYAIDASYRWERFGVRAGAHDLGGTFGSLAQAVATGMRDWYLGTDWSLTPQLSWSVELRNTLTRGLLQAVLPALPGQPVLPPALSDMDSLTQRLNYNVASLPGLALALTDTRSRSKDGTGARQENDQAQASISYATGPWSLQGSGGLGRTSASLTPAYDGRLRNWQLGVGRSFDNGNPEVPASWTVSTYLFVGGQTQTLATGRNESTSLGLTVSAQMARWGQLSLTLQQQRTQQPVAGAPGLRSSNLGFDWTCAVTPQWSLRAYARAQRFNQGSATLAADERVAGVSAGYKW
jgi:hypothetical protein